MLADAAGGVAVAIRRIQTKGRDYLDAHHATVSRGSRRERAAPARAVAGACTWDS